MLLHLCSLVGIAELPLTNATVWRGRDNLYRKHAITPEFLRAYLYLPSYLGRYSWARLLLVLLPTSAPLLLVGIAELSPTNAKLWRIRGNLRNLRLVHTWVCYRQSRYAHHTSLTWNSNVHALMWWVYSPFVIGDTCIEGFVVLKWRTLRHTALSWSLLPAKRSMYTSWSLDCPLSTAGRRVLLLYNQRRLFNFLGPIILFLALHQMALDLLTPITTRPVSAELKNWCLVILGCVASAEEMAAGVHEYNRGWNILLLLFYPCVGSHLSATALLESRPSTGTAYPSSVRYIRHGELWNHVLTWCQPSIYSQGLLNGPYDMQQWRHAVRFETLRYISIEWLQA